MLLIYHKLVSPYLLPPLYKDLRLLYLCEKFIHLSHLVTQNERKITLLHYNITIFVKY